VSDQESGQGTFDPSQPHIARVYDHLLGGKDNYAADRAVADQIVASLPTVQVGVREQRALLGRVVRYLVEEAGITQLIDIGSGLPTADNVHQIARRIEPRTRVIYVDSDAVVLNHARALLAGDPATIVVDGDVRRPATILDDPDVLGHLDWGRPIGLLFCGILHHILDEERPGKLVEALCRPLPSGSYVFIHHLVDSGDPAIADVQAAMQRGLGRGQFRTWEQIRDLFTGLDLVEPGLVPISDWRPGPDTPRADDQPVMRLACAGVARKP